MSVSERPDFESVRNRLAEIADAIDDEGLPLDDALSLYEEAVALGLQASDLLETGIEAPESGAGEAGVADTDAAHADAAQPDSVAAGSVEQA